MSNLLAIQPLSVTVVPGTSVTVVLPPTLNTAIGAAYDLDMEDIAANHTGKEEVIISVSASELPSVDNYNRYITSQMLYNPDKRSPRMSNRFRIQFVASGTGTAVAFRRGLAKRKTYLDVNTPPTP